jgi:hypothetical protein
MPRQEKAPRSILLATALRLLHNEGMLDLLLGEIISFTDLLY